MCMVDPVWINALSGASGGAIRGLVGYFNKVKDNKDIEWNWNKFLQSLLRSGAVGLVGGLTILQDPVSSFLAGFSGDVILHDLGLKV